GGWHTFTALDVTPDPDGIHNDLKVYDNTNWIGDKPYIDIHDIDQAGELFDENSNPALTTIYRLSPDHLYLIQGSNFGDRLVGTQHDDHIMGGSGDDILRGGTGNDWLEGRGGSDTADYSWDDKAIVADLQHGSVDKGIYGIDPFEKLTIERFIGGPADDTFI